VPRADKARELGADARVAGGSVRRVELDEQRGANAWAVVFTLSACVVAAAVIAIIVMLAQVS
jgi:hypothetical protein